MKQATERVGTFQLVGEARGSALVLSQALSFWGGINPVTGDIIDRSHQDFGGNVAGKILIMPSGRGSSSSSSVLAEAIRMGTAPAGILLARPDPILAVGAIVAEYLYGIRMPLIVCETMGIVSGEGIAITIGEGGRALITARILKYRKPPENT